MWLTNVSSSQEVDIIDEWKCVQGWETRQDGLKTGSEQDDSEQRRDLKIPRPEVDAVRQLSII